MSAKNNAVNRIKLIIKTSIIGIIVNVLLSIFKAAVGLITGSIAITLDAVNNLSDALSSTITIVGTRIAAKPADREHPYGHGRVEYLTAMIIAVIILYAGATSLIESVKKILDPQVPEYTITSLIIITVAVIAKILLGTYVKRTGKAVNSDSLVASGTDALMDSIISATTLIAAIIYIFAHLSLEAYLAAIISIIIIKSGYDMLKDTISQILGERAETDLTDSIKKTINSFDKVNGTYDLILNNYGPDIYLASAHIEIPSDMTAGELDALTRTISAKVYEEHQVILAAVGIYAVDKNDKETSEMLCNIEKIAAGYPDILQIHGFYLNKETSSISFDVIIDFASKDRMRCYKEFCESVQNAYPDHNVDITNDVDFSG